MSHNTTVPLPPSSFLGCDRYRTCLLLPCQPHEELGPGPSNEMLKVRCLARLEEAGASVVDLGFMCFMGLRGRRTGRPVLATVGFVDPYQDTYICTLDTYSHLWGGEGRTGHGVTSCTVSVPHLTRALAASCLVNVSHMGTSSLH